MRKTAIQAILANERIWVQNIMRGGLVLSVLMMSVGLVIHILGGDMQGQGISMWSLFGGGLSSPDFFLTLGVFILALTPAFRVLMLMVLWAAEGDWRFVGVAALVMGALILSISLGGH